MAKYKPIFVTMDEACRYVQAKHNLEITEVVYENGVLTLAVNGKTDVPIRCFLFTENLDREILSEFIDIPIINGVANIPYTRLV